MSRIRPTAASESLSLLERARGDDVGGAGPGGNLDFVSGDGDIASFNKHAGAGCA